jgi:hypothetical protein
MVVGFEVLTPVVTKNSIFLDITPCSPLNVNRRCGGTYLNIRVRRISLCFHVGLLFGLFFHPEDRGDMFLRNVG